MDQVISKRPIALGVFLQWENSRTVAPPCHPGGEWVHFFEVWAAGSSFITGLSGLLSCPPGADAAWMEPSEPLGAPGVHTFSRLAVSLMAGQRARGRGGRRHRVCVPAALPEPAPGGGTSFGGRWPPCRTLSGDMLPRSRV